MKMNIFMTQKKDNFLYQNSVKTIFSILYRSWDDRKLKWKVYEIH